MRFVPDELRAFEALERSHLASFGHDTSVCVRLEGIDAPELHYEGAQQPAAKPALELFRRSVTYFRDAARGMSFCTWLRDKSGADDEVSAGGGP